MRLRENYKCGPLLLDPYSFSFFTTVCVLCYFIIDVQCYSFKYFLLHPFSSLLPDAARTLHHLDFSYFDVHLLSPRPT